MSVKTWLWDLIGKTDPKNTKPFKRKGGFEGTAIRPMSSIQKMTEVFGPCGSGWGYNAPSFEIHTMDDGQKLVYCTVGLWYKDPSNGEKSEPVYGVGGDYVVGSGKYGLSPDDEAYKKSFTDALMNAMKHIGMAADIHMGQFDGNKYVTPPPENKPIKNTPKDNKEHPVGGPVMEWDVVKEELELAAKEGRIKQSVPMPDDEYEIYRDIIAGAEDMDKLKELFTGAVEKAKSYGDKPAIEGFTKIKDIRKAELGNK